MEDCCKQLALFSTICDGIIWGKLQLQAYAAIRQCIDLQCKLHYYDRAQVGEYIKRHLKYAGAVLYIFSDSTIDEIFRFSSGAMRLVNKVGTEWSPNTR